ncbi:DUF6264 family protein [Agromyces subbeticus]|uniref:DUF6264 family protein n=1 Tax=Agromyces subbeticus TaxID=293890 RepID=UPI0003B7258A|nr:DUF6264 family protein [Agromyces subbeticus]
MSQHEAARTPDESGDSGATHDGTVNPPAVPSPPRDERPRPQYGEYAPEGWTWTPPVDDRGAPAAAAASAAATAPKRTPGRDRPAKSPSGASSTAGRSNDELAASALPLVRPERSVDRMITIGLLVIGAFGAWSTASGLQQLPQQIQLVYTQQGIGDFTPGASMPTIILVGTLVQLAIYAATLGLSIRRLRRRRMAFWIPIVGGAVSFIAMMVLMSIVFFADPTFMEYVGTTVGG